MQSVEQSISILSDRFAQYQLEVIPNVIALMESDKENVEMLIRCHQLIDQLTSDQLKQLESDLKDGLIDVLLIVVKLHCGNSLIVENFCNLLLKIGVVPYSVVDYLTQIACVFDHFADQTNLDSSAPKSALQLLIAVAQEFRSDQRKFPTKWPFVENICGLIRGQLDKSQNDEILELLEIGWFCLWQIDDGSIGYIKRFLNSDGLNVLRLCYQKFSTQTKLVSRMISVMLILSDHKSIRKVLVADGMLQFAWQIWSETNVGRISCDLCLFLSKFLNDSSVNWPTGQPTKVEVEKKLTSTMLERSKTDSFRKDLQMFGEFQDLLKFLWKLWRNTKDLQIRYFCSRIFSNILCMAPDDWPLQLHPTIEQIKTKLWGKKWRKHMLTTLT